MADDLTEFLYNQQVYAQNNAVGNIDADPEEAARALQLSGDTGVDSQAIYGDVEGFEKQHKAQLAQQLIRGNPLLQEYVNSHPLAGTVSNDDWGNLDTVSQHMQRLVGTRAGKILSAPGDILEAAVKGFAKPFTETGFGAPLITDDPYTRDFAQNHPFLYTQAFNTLLGLDIPVELFNRTIEGVIGGAGAGLEVGAQAFGASPQQAQSFKEAATGTADTLMQMGMTGEIPHVPEVTRDVAQYQRNVMLNKLYQDMKPYIENGEKPPVGLHPILDNIYAEQAKLDMKNYDNLMSAALDSATRERSPDLFNQFLQLHSNAKIGIDAEAVRKLYGDKPVEVGDKILGWVPGMKDQLPLAEAHGGDVEIPLSEWLAYVDPEVAKELHDHIRVRPEGMTLKETKELASAPELEEQPKFSIASGPSKDFNPPDFPTDRHAHTIQLQDEEGNVHYRGEITQEANNIWGVGHVENVSRQFSQQAPKLYQEMAKYAEERGGKLYGGMNTNRLSEAVHQQLYQKGLAREEKVGQRSLTRILSNPESNEIASVRRAAKLENPSFAPGLRRGDIEEGHAYENSIASRIGSNIKDGGEVELRGTKVESLYQFSLGDAMKALHIEDIPKGPDRFLHQFFAGKVAELGADVPVHVISAEQMKQLRPERPKTPGYYYDEHGHIVIQENYVNGIQPPWVTNHILLHEGIHAISVRELYNYPEMNNVVKQLMKVADGALSPDDRVAHKYAFTDEREFLAEGMSKSAFREALAKIPLPKEIAERLNLEGKTGTVWDAFKNILKQLWAKIFKKVPEHSILDAFFRIGEALEQSRKEDAADVREAGAEEPEKTPFKTPGAMGLTVKQMKRFQELFEKRKAEDAKFQQEQGEKLERDRQTKEWKDNYPRVREEAKRDLKARPDIASERFLRTGELYDQKTRKVRIVQDSLTPEQIAKLPKEFVGKEGIHADDLAGLFGYTSGDAMVEGLANLEKERGMEGLTPQAHYTKLLDAETDRRMRREFGDLEHNILEAAKDHVLGQTQMDLLSEEMLALGEKAHGQLSITKDDLKRWVKEQFNKVPLGSHSSAKYLAAAGRAGKATEDALLEDDAAGAFKAKQDQYISTLLASEARKLEKERAAFDKTAKRFSKREVGGLPAEYTNWVHDILLRTGNFVRRSIQDLEDAKRREAHQTLQSFTEAKNQDARIWQEDENAPSDFQVMPVAEFLFDPAYRKKVDEMSPEEFRAMFNSVKTIIKNGRDEQKITVAGDKVDLKETIGKLTGRLEELFGGKGKQYAFGHKDTGVGFYIRTAWASLLQIESIFNRFDQGDPKGIFARVLTRPIFSAANDRDTLESKYSKLYKALPKFGDLKKKVDNPLFGDPLNNWEVKQDFNRGNLLAVLQNVGNPSQLDKLARGYRIEDPNLIMQWLFGKTTKEDWDRAQAMGDLFEQVFEESARMYHSLSGVAPEKIDIRPIQTPWGEYRGWYHPIVYDPLRPGSSKKLMGPAAMEDGAYYRAATPSGYTKKRTGYAAPIQLNFEAVPAKLRSMINDIAMRPTVTDVSKVFYDPSFQMAMTKYYGKEVKDLMIPYLKDIAGMKQYKDAAQNAALRALEAVRQNVVATLIGFNPTTVMKHGPTAAMLSMKEVGPGNFLRELKGLTSFNDNLGEKNWNFAMKTSEELQRRHRNWQETLTGAQANLFEENTLRNTVIKAGAAPVAISDLLSAVPTWLAAYKDQVRQGIDQGEAVGFADRAVRRAHGSSAVAARPRIMRGGPLAQFATPFYTFFNEMFQRQYEMAWKAKDALGMAREGDLQSALKEVPGLMGGLWAYVVFPALIEQAVSPIVTGKDSYAESAIKWGARTLGSSIPILRDMIEAYLGNRDPTIGLYSTAAGAINDIVKDVGRGQISLNKAHAGKTIRHTATAFGALTGLTNAQEGKTGEFVYDVMTGQQKPKNATEVLKGLWHGQIKEPKR